MTKLLAHKIIPSISMSTDTFNRSRLSGWGTGPLGTWTFLPEGWAVNDSLSVNATGAYGQFDPEAAQGNDNHSHELHYKGTVTDIAELPGSGNTLWDYYLHTGNGEIYAWSGSAWVDNGHQGSDGVLALLDVVPPGVIEMRIRFSIENTTTDSDYEQEPQFYLAGNSGGPYITMHYWHGIDFWIDKSSADNPSDLGDTGYWAAYGYGSNQPGDVDFIETGGEYYTWGDIVNLHMKFEGGRVTANLWMDGETEPYGPMIAAGNATYSDWSTYGPIDTFYIYVPNVGQSVRVYDVAMTVTSPMGALTHFPGRFINQGLSTDPSLLAHFIGRVVCTILDNFDRSTSSGVLGDATIGGTWFPRPRAPYTTTNYAYTDGSNLVFPDGDYPNPMGSTEQELAVDLSDVAPSGEMTFRMRFRSTGTIDGGALYFGITDRLPPWNSSYWYGAQGPFVEIDFQNGPEEEDIYQVSIWGGDALWDPDWSGDWVDIPGVVTTFVQNDWFLMDYHFVPGVKHEVRVWPEGDAMPDYQLVDPLVYRWTTANPDPTYGDLTIKPNYLWIDGWGHEGTVEVAWVTVKAGDTGCDGPEAPIG